jgi:hypothetical protein
MAHRGIRHLPFAAIVTKIDDEVSTAEAAISRVSEGVRKALSNSTNPSLKELDRVYNAAGQMLSAASGALSGLGFVANAKYFDNTSGLIWCTLLKGSQRPKRLNVDADFYDYTTAEWWSNAQVDDKVHVTGAYVDASGTNEYIVTFSKRTALDDGTIVGVAAADVLVGQFQSLLQTHLVNLPKNSCVIDQEGVVVATNSAKLLGASWPPEQPIRDTIDLPRIGWRLIVGA